MGDPKGKGEKAEFLGLDEGLRSRPDPSMLQNCLFDYTNLEKKKKKNKLASA